MYEHRNGITYRKIEVNDLGWLRDLKNESWWGTHGSPIINYDDQQKWFQSLGSDTLVMIAQTTQLSQVGTTHDIGVGIYSNIDWVARTCDLSGSIKKEFRGKEEVPSAFRCGLDFGFEMLNMHRIQCEVVEYNLAAQKLETEHFGFKVEGRRREAVYKAGRYYDSILLGILREDWKQKIVTSSCCNNVDHEQYAKNASQVKDLGLLQE